MSLEMKARVAGRQAQMRATLHSIADHWAAPTLSSDGLVLSSSLLDSWNSHVWSVELDMTIRLCRRRQLVTRTLKWLVDADTVETEGYKQSTKGKNCHQGNLLPLR